MEMPALERARVLVVGDVMLDRYWHGSTSRISPEAPVPVVHVAHSEVRPGGAANVALNVAALGARADLVGVVGEDEAAAELRRILTRADVSHELISVPGLTTTTKLRVISHHQQLMRLDFEDRIDPESRSLADAIERRLAHTDVLVLSDYGKGTLGAIRALIRSARVHGVSCFVDPKGRDFARYAGADLVTPNFAEFEAATGPCRSPEALAEGAQRLRRSLGIGALLVTQGEGGMTLLTEAGPTHFPARAREVFDVTGAGDTVIAVLAAAVAAGAGLAQAAELANVAAGMVVGRLGTASVTRQSLRAAFAQAGGENADESGVREAPGVVSEAQAVRLVAGARARGETVVLTNGCFDLLHPGHVACLEQARALGDRLVVAVNDDASVHRLKGSGRPVQPLAARMQLLAALRPVDWVVDFSEDTPSRLIGRLSPDVLVKGGDYRTEEIAGARDVRDRGGRVEVLAYRPGASTSGLIDAIRNVPAPGEGTK